MEPPAASGFWDQTPYDIRCEWGRRGVAALAPISDVVIVVDVLSFSTCVDIAVARGATVYPCRPQEDAAAYASRLGAVLAGRPGAADTPLPFSIAAMLSVRAGQRLVIPSPNGSTLSLVGGSTTVLAGCLRNARAVAAAAARLGRRVAVIPAGERWFEDEHGDRSLRPAAEDWIGAGAIIAHLPGSRSPEAELALAAFRAVRGRLPAFLEGCSSGRELIARGTAADLGLAAQLNVSDFAPRLVDGAYVVAAGDGP